MSCIKLGNDLNFPSDFCLHMLRAFKHTSKCKQGRWSFRVTHGFLLERFCSSSGRQSLGSYFHTKAWPSSHGKSIILRLETICSFMKSSSSFQDLPFHFNTPWGNSAEEKKRAPFLPWRPAYHTQFVSRHSTLIRKELKATWPKGGYQTNWKYSTFHKN